MNFQNQNIAPQLVLSDLSFCFLDSLPGLIMLSFSPTSKKAYVELSVGKKVEGIPVPLVLLSQRLDPSGERCHKP